MSFLKKYRTLILGVCCVLCVIGVSLLLILKPFSHNNTPNTNTSSNESQSPITPDSPTVTPTSEPESSTPTNSTSNDSPEVVTENGKTYIQANGNKKEISGEEISPEDTQDLGLTLEERASFLENQGFTGVQANIAKNVTSQAVQFIPGDTKEKRQARFGNLLEPDASIFGVTDLPTAPPSGYSSAQASKITVGAANYNGYYMIDKTPIMKVKVEFSYSTDYEKDGFKYTRTGRGVVNVVMPYFAETGNTPRDVFILNSTDS